MNEIDIYRAANLLIKQHGEEALLVAVKKNAKFSELGDKEGARVWNRIADAVTWLTIPANMVSEQCH
jgi:hypothetical protein